MQTTINTITETVKPVLAKAVEKTTPVLTSAIEGAITLVERLDPTASQREPVFRASASEPSGVVNGDSAPAQEEKKVDATSPASQAAVVDPL